MEQNFPRKGEWQKLCYLGCYGKTPEILILDELTASVDPIQEMELPQQILEII